MSFYLYLGLPKPPFEPERLFPDFVDLAEMTDTPIGRAVLGSSRFGKAFSVTQLTEHDHARSGVINYS